MEGKKYLVKVNEVHLVGYIVEAMNEHHARQLMEESYVRNVPLVKPSGDECFNKNMNIVSVEEM